MKQKIACSQYIAHFKEAIDWIWSVGGRDEIKKVCKFLDEITGGWEKSY